jgi:mono/diheme cytochrome c family protein
MFPRIRAEAAGIPAGAAARRRFGSLEVHMRPTIAAALAILLVTAGVAVSGDGSRQPKRPSGRGAAVVTAVAGPSWLNHLSIGYRDTSLGRGAGRYGGSPTDLATERRPVVLQVGGSVALAGADLYRLNCQGCHRAEGTGAPPEVRSVLPAVEGSSFEMMRHQLQLQGRAGASGETRAKAATAKAALYNRVRKGGQKMPPRAYLRDADIDLLYGYLTQLAGAPAAGVPSHTTVSWARVGENVVKGTCHVCHDAAGPRPSGKALLDGATPPLSSLIADKSAADFVNKVRVGAPILMGDLPIHYRGRMPVFYYLKDQEVAAAYLFLANYPPQAK